MMACISTSCTPEGPSTFWIYPTGNAAAYPTCKVFIGYNGIGESPCGTADLIGVMTDNQADIAGTGALCR